MWKAWGSEEVTEREGERGRRREESRGEAWTAPRETAGASSLLRCPSPQHSSEDASHGAGDFPLLVVILEPPVPQADPMRILQSSLGAPRLGAR